MSNRTASKNSDTVGLFPFLAVLLCTMGALLVLLVVLAQRAGERTLDGTAGPLLAEGASPEELQRAEELREQLAEAREYQRQADEVLSTGRKRLAEEQARLTHSEEHTRRLRLELAKLSLAAEQLKSTEENNSVDQEQADREVARLERLISDTEEQLETLRDESVGRHSYAIVPYQGPNGTYRKPIYIECSGSGIVIHPEGIQLSASDFAATEWPGNPLAALLRASRDHLNSRAASSGAPHPPDPYPILLVRPSGIKQYGLARAAITSWDSDYGYEFIEEDMKIAFQELPDPQLAQIQKHALDVARQRLLQLAQAAPSRFRGMNLGAGGSADASGGLGGGGLGDSSAGADSWGGGEGDGVIGSTSSGGDGDGTASSEGLMAGGGGLGDGGDEPGGQQLGGAGSESGDDFTGQGTGGGAGGSHHASVGGEGPADSGNLGSETGSAGGTTRESGASATGNVAGDSGSSSGADAGTMAAGPPQSSSSGGGNPSAVPSGGSQAAGAPPTEQEAGATATMQFTNKQTTIADAKGRNWAVKQQSGGVPIRRSIHVVVKQDTLELLPTRFATSGAEAQGRVISLNQSLNEVSNEFATALDERIEEWGLAGHGMYWRPVLELSVQADAGPTVERVGHLLKDSGVEVRLPETAELGPGSRPVRKGN